MSNRTIWKYELEITDKQSIKVPPGSNFLSAQMQGFQLCLWATVDPDRVADAERHITIVGTGNPMPEGIYRFIDTVQDHRGLVWHVFEG